MYQLLVLMAMGLALVGGQIPNLGWCPEYVPMADFDMDKYLGTWYEQERYFRVMEAGSRCVRTNYTKAVDGRILVASEITGRLSGVKRILSGIKDRGANPKMSIKSGIKRILEGEIPFLIKGTESKINVKYSTLPFPIEMSYTILETDYDAYSVVWSCSGLGPVNTQSAWLMTRDRLPPGTVMQKAYGVLDKYKISRTFFVKTDHSECAIAEALAAKIEETTVIQKSAGPIAEEPMHADKTKTEIVGDVHVAKDKEVVKPAIPAVPASDDVHVPVIVDKPFNDHNVHHDKPHKPHVEPSKHSEMPSKHPDMPSKHSDMPSKHSEMPIKHSDSNKHSETSNKHGHKTH